MRSKYRNVPVTTIDGQRFASRKEAARWQELRIMERAGLIMDVRRQVPYELMVNGHTVARYVADFVFQRDGRQVVEDVKSPPTRRLASYRIKKKLLRACHGVEILET